MLKYTSKKGASCPNRPLPCEKDRYKDSDGDNVQILSGALVAGPDESENYIGEFQTFFSKKEIYQLFLFRQSKHTRVHRGPTRSQLLLHRRTRRRNRNRRGELEGRGRERVHLWFAQYWLLHLYPHPHALSSALIFLWKRDCILKTVLNLQIALCRLAEFANQIGTSATRTKKHKNHCT